MTALPAPATQASAARAWRGRAALPGGAPSEPSPHGWEPVQPAWALRAPVRQKRAAVVPAAERRASVPAAGRRALVPVAEQRASAQAEEPLPRASAAAPRASSPQGQPASGQAWLPRAV
jgi:hypothetical protein